jgi:asparagine synthase (glutamine-hydrolysing)
MSAHRTGDPITGMAGVFDPHASPAQRRALLGATGSSDALLEDGPLTVAAAQGPRNGHGRIVCVLDGMIYEPERLGTALAEPATGRPETLIAKAWEQLGDRALELLRGDFTVLLWDSARQHGVVACDHLGTRSMSYAASGARLVFGSEVRDVLPLLPRRPEPDEAALAHWLAGAGPPGGRTLYAGVLRLLGGRCLRFSESGCGESAWWRPRYSPPISRSREELVETLLHLLEQSVRRRLTTDGKTGFMLSGGLDSAAVAGVATGGGTTRGLRAYSAVFPNHPTVDETAFVDRLCDRFRLRSVRVEADVGPLLDEALDYLHTWQLPPSSPNLFFWMPLLRGAAADGVQVLLDGEGGDELFGVARWLVADKLRQRHPLTAWRLARRFPGAGDAPALRPLIDIVLQYGVRGVVPWRLHHAVRTARGPRRYAPQWLTPSAQRAYFESSDPWVWKQLTGPRWWAGLLEAMTNTEGAVVARDHVRRRAAIVGLDARHHLLDVDLVEFVLGIDPEEAYNPHLSRPLLRESVRGLVPDEVRRRPTKSTFDAVFHRSLVGPSWPSFVRLLSARDAEIRRYADAADVEAMLRGPAPPQGRRAWSIALWRLATAECWLRAEAGADLPEGVRSPEWAGFPIS